MRIRLPRSHTHTHTPFKYVCVRAAVTCLRVRFSIRRRRRDDGGRQHAVKSTTQSRISHTSGRSAPPPPSPSLHHVHSTRTEHTHTHTRAHTQPDVGGCVLIFNEPHSTTEYTQYVSATQHHVCVCVYATHIFEISLSHTRARHILNTA